MLKVRKEIVAVCVLLLFVVAVVFYIFYVNAKSAEEGSAAAQALSGGKDNKIEFTDLDGEPVSLDTYGGKVRVVNAWATWCPFCVKELQAFSQASATFDQNDVVFIAINRNESDAKAKAFVDKLPNTDGILFVQDHDDVFFKNIGGFSMPETIFYDKKGNVVFHKKGPMEFDEIVSHVSRALEVE